MALVASVLHCVGSELPKWMVSLGLFSPPDHGAPSGGMPEIGAIQSFFNSQRGTAEVLGEWSFYAAVVLIALALIKRLPYKYFVSTHKLISIAYLHKPRLLSDNGSSYVSGDLAMWLEDQQMDHVRGAPYHPQTRQV